MISVQPQQRYKMSLQGLLRPNQESQSRKIIKICNSLRDKIIFTSVINLLMSEQVDGLLQTPASYDFQRQRLSLYNNDLIRSHKFHQWTKEHMYRSSYAQHHSPDSVVPRASHIPGYGGFIPKDRAESLHAKTYANKTKQVFGSPEINMNRSGLATTGFNITKDALIDKSKNASSHKYGKTEIQRSHPAWVPAEWISTTKATYVSPEKNGDPLYRESDKNATTKKLATKTSGFQQNRDYWDGQGWKPNPILNPKNLTSEYRDRFNPEMQFHRQVNKDALAQLKPKEYKYHYNK